MALEKDFLDIAEGEIILDPSTEVTLYGAHQFSTAQRQRLPARVEPGNRLVVGADGKEVVASATLFVLSSSATIRMEDRLTLPDGRTPRLLRVDVLNDEQGQHHLEVYIG